MDINDKLDEDFLFYLGFTSSGVQQLKKCDVAKAQQWLQRLCGETFATVAQKRNRNIFLSNLILDLQEKQLSGPFLQNPEEVSLEDPSRYFPAVSSEVTTPQWVTDVQYSGDVQEGRSDGRTYVATRSMPGGEGAFAYVAISMNEEPMWLGGGEGVFDEAMQAKYKEYVPPQSEMEVILARRKDVEERRRVVTFYEVILQNIADELDGKIAAAENADVSGLLQQLVKDLKQRGEYEGYGYMSEEERRTELLHLLFELTHRRKTQTQHREEVLDQIGEELHTSFFEASGISEENKYEMPAAMWEYCINRPPAKKSLDLLRATYPSFVVETFLELLASAKEEMALQMQRRHAHIISQMKQDLKTEGDKMKSRLEDVRQQCEQMEVVLDAVRAAYEKQQKSKERTGHRKKGGQTDLTGLYEQMRAALLETQTGVEQEFDRGHNLVEQINDVNAQTEMYSEITERTIRMTEEANMELMKNVKRLRATIRMHEARVAQLLQMQEADEDAGRRRPQQMFFM